MKCPECGLYNPDTAMVCDCGHRFGMSNNVPKHRHFSKTGVPKQIILVSIVIVLGLVLIFFLSFHIVSNTGGISVFPKDHLSFADTFVNVDDLTQEYNKRSLGEN